MKHITLTGQSAGIPICGVNKRAAAERGDTFQHAPYCGIDGMLTEQDVCPDCVKVWNDADTEQPSAPTQI